MAGQKGKGFFSWVREMFGNWKKRRAFRQHEKYSQLETEHRRHQAWRNINRFARGFWDETNVGRRLEKILRKRTRAEETEKIQRAKEKTHERNSRVAKLCDTPGYRDFVTFQQKCERIAYMGLRHPELRTDKHSMDYYIGFQNGLLSNIEDNRKFFEDAVFGIERESLKNDKTIG